MSSYRIITDYYSCTYKNNKKVRDLKASDSNSKVKKSIKYQVSGHKIKDKRTKITDIRLATYYSLLFYTFTSL